jgi:hypothetical protein
MKITQLFIVYLLIVQLSEVYSNNNISPLPNAITLTKDLELQYDFKVESDYVHILLKTTNQGKPVSFSL